MRGDKMGDRREREERAIQRKKGKERDGERERQ